MAPHSSRQPIIASKYLVAGRRIEQIEVQRYQGDNIPGDIWVDLADGAMWERGNEIFDTYEEAARVVIAGINDEIRGLIAERQRILQQRPGRRIGEEVHTTSLARTLGNQGV